MKAAALLLTLLLMGCESAEVRVKGATAHINTPFAGDCSATYVGPKLLLSASHCFVMDSGPITINGKAGEIVSIRHDGHDLAVVVVTVESPHWAKVGKKAQQGDAVFYYGNPNSLRDLLRRGYVIGVYEDRTLVDMQVGRGDSGAGVFNRKGELVGVMASIFSAPPSFHVGAIRDAEGWQ